MQLLYCPANASTSINQKSKHLSFIPYRIHSFSFWELHRSSSSSIVVGASAAVAFPSLVASSIEPYHCLYRSIPIRQPSAMPHRNPSIVYGLVLLCLRIAHGFTAPSLKLAPRGNGDTSFITTQSRLGSPLHMQSENSSSFSMEEVPLAQIFQKAVVLQRSGDRSGALREYQQFLNVAKSHDVDPSLYVSSHML